MENYKKDFYNKQFMIQEKKIRGEQEELLDHSSVLSL